MDNDDMELPIMEEDESQVERAPTPPPEKRRKLTTLEKQAIAKAQEKGAFITFVAVYFLQLAFSVTSFAVTIAACMDREWVVKWEIDGVNRWPGDTWSMPVGVAVAYVFSAAMGAIPVGQYLRYITDSKAMANIPLTDKTRAGGLGITDQYVDMMSRSKYLFLFKGAFEAAMYVQSAHIANANQLGNIVLGAVQVIASNVCLAHNTAKSTWIYRVICWLASLQPWLFLMVNILTDTRSTLFTAAFWIATSWVLFFNTAIIVSSYQYHYLIYGTYAEDGEAAQKDTADALDQVKGGKKFNVFMSMLYFALAFGAGIPAFMSQGELKANVSYNIGDSEKMKRTYNAGQIVYFLPAMVMSIGHMISAWWVGQKNGTGSMLDLQIRRDTRAQRAYIVGHFAFVIAEALLFLQVASTGGISEVGEIACSCILIFTVGVLEYVIESRILLKELKSVGRDGQTKQEHAVLLQRGTELTVVGGSKFLALAPYVLAMASAVKRNTVDTWLRWFTLLMLCIKALHSFVLLIFGKQVANDTQHGGCMTENPPSEQTRARIIYASQFIFVVLSVVIGYAAHMLL